MSPVEDRLDVIDVCTRLGWYTDQREWDALTGLFAEKTVLDYTSLNGGEPVALTPEQIVSAWSGLLGKLEATQHLITNHLAEVQGDEAVCTAAFQATHLLPNAHGGPLWTLGGHYRFDLVRAERTWKIARVVMTAVWATGNQHILTLAAGG
ncbi:nuclear transport factor 2 family protein [Streptosporangium sp. NPDC000396]|uniref:nuclear transport factor 2 family protein n=1 Tax=Streptosporangium sp. NPDC000396 TaxID=3366185 RepID=UPI00368620BE